MRGIDGVPPPKREQDLLMVKMLAGETPPTEVYARLLELDQSTPDRHQAFTNYEVLTDPTVVTFTETQPEEVQIEYYRILGFTEFHLGQIKALEDQMHPEALALFTSSLRHAEQALEEEEWTAYVAATVAYFEGDIEKLDKVSMSSEITGNNRSIVENMKKGLRERGTINYREDYRV